MHKRSSRGISEGRRAGLSSVEIEEAGEAIFVDPELGIKHVPANLTRKQMADIGPGEGGAEGRRQGSRFVVVAANFMLAFMFSIPNHQQDLRVHKGFPPFPNSIPALDI